MVGGSCQCTLDFAKGEYMIRCDLCDQAKPCVQKQIDGREFDICERCWHALEDKLRGKGRVKESPEEVEEYVEAEI